MTATVTCSFTFDNLQACEFCGEMCSSMRPEFVQCLSCALAEDELRDRLVAEYEAMEAAAGWGESLTAPEPDLYDDGERYSEILWEPHVAEIRAKGFLLLGVKRERLGVVALGYQKQGIGVRLLGAEVVALWAADVPAPVRIGPGRYVVDSFTGEGKSYVVNLQMGTCTCGQYVHRLAETGGVCKHMRRASLEETVTA